MALRSRRSWTTIVFGVFLGFTVSSWLIVPQVLENKRKKSPECLYFSDSSARKSPDQAPRDQDSLQAGPEEVRGFSPGVNSTGDTGRAVNRPNHFLYVGVMTAKKYLRSRAVAAYNTWASSIPGKVEFYSSAGSGTVPSPGPLPVISLAGVDDSYPPQKKSFMMLKYIHDHYLDKYEWFMRADDDVYIRGDYTWDLMTKRLCQSERNTPYWSTLFMRHVASFADVCFSFRPLSSGYISTGKNTCKVKAICSGGFILFLLHFYLK